MSRDRHYRHLLELDADNAGMDPPGQADDYEREMRDARKLWREMMIADELGMSLEQYLAYQREMEEK